MIQSINNIPVVNAIYPDFPRVRPDGEQAAAVADRVSISREARSLFSGEKENRERVDEDAELSEEEKRQVAELKKRDQEVRAHERAHIAAGGGLVQGGASCQFQRGPDGRMYAVGGEVRIDTSSERDPNQTIRKMQQVRRAALAPANPSGTDRSVAARASQIEAQARQQKTQMENAERGAEQNVSPQTTEPADSSQWGESDPIPRSAKITPVFPPSNAEASLNVYA